MSAKPPKHIERLSERKKKSIVEAAQTVFMDQGYSKSSMAHIANKADVSTATLYNHFSSKQELFGAVMREVWGELTFSIDPAKLQGLPVKEALIQIGQSYASLLGQDIMRPLFRVIIAEAESFPELGQELYDQGKKPSLKTVETYLKCMTKEGSLVVPNPELATRQFLGMINDIVFWPRLLVVDLEISKKQVNEAVVEAAETFLARYRNTSNG